VKVQVNWGDGNMRHSGLWTEVDPGKKLKETVFNLQLLFIEELRFVGRS
jgi:hypothetical protein